MLFLLNSAGVPSVAAWVQITSTPGNQPPTGTITSPSGDMTIRAGQSVTFAGSGTDPDGSIAAYAWAFPGGTPDSSTSATPGAVAFSTPGVYDVTLIVTDNAGTSDPSPPTRRITVQPAVITASFTSPAPNATVAGTQPVGMAVTNATGNSNTFTLTIDGTPTPTIVTSATTATYSWDTRPYSIGPHTLGLTVRDASGNTATATLSVNVNNNPSSGEIGVTFPNLSPGQTVRGLQSVQIQAANTRRAGPGLHQRHQHRLDLEHDGPHQRLAHGRGAGVGLHRPQRHRQPVRDRAELAAGRHHGPGVGRDRERHHLDRRLGRLSERHLERLHGHRRRRGRRLADGPGPSCDGPLGHHEDGERTSHDGGPGAGRHQQRRPVHPAGDRAEHDQPARGLVHEPGRGRHGERGRKRRPQGHRRHRPVHVPPQDRRHAGVEHHGQHDDVVVLLADDDVRQRRSRARADRDRLARQLHLGHAHREHPERGAAPDRFVHRAGRGRHRERHRGEHRHGRGRRQAELHLSAHRERDADLHVGVDKQHGRVHDLELHDGGQRHVHARPHRHGCRGRLRHGDALDHGAERRGRHRKLHDPDAERHRHRRHHRRHDGQRRHARLHLSPHRGWGPDLHHEHDGDLRLDVVGHAHRRQGHPHAGAHRHRLGRRLRHRDADGHRQQQRHPASVHHAAGRRQHRHRHELGGHLAERLQRDVQRLHAVRRRPGRRYPDHEQHRSRVDPVGHGVGVERQHGTHRQRARRHRQHRRHEQHGHRAERAAAAHGLVHEPGGRRHGERHERQRRHGGERRHPGLHVSPHRRRRGALHESDDRDDGHL
ncbi:MAG: hypothetical protein DMD78_10745 [Candidatus Rokuibacteriota bacterium]|nr:MAG: hypothetical protein DMD78_10745 [Candidatus Rokubacteria bacterium]